MNKQIIQSFTVVGLSIRTTNENGQSSKDIPVLWERFMREDVLNKIPFKTDNTLYCVYTQYEKDHTRPYTTMPGCKVSKWEDIPDGLSAVEAGGGNYSLCAAKGSIFEGIIFNRWSEIWNADWQRRYTSDFEVYGEKAHDPANAEVDIFIAVQ